MSNNAHPTGQIPPRNSAPAQIEIEGEEYCLALEPRRLGQEVSITAPQRGLVFVYPLIDAFSEFSGDPAYHYRSEKATLLLTLDEIFRMARRAFIPEEFFKLRGGHGVFFEIGEGFYNQATGTRTPGS